jgi:sugar phosphate isomerase/epimerase
LSLDETMERLVDLEFSGIEIVVSEEEGQLKPSDILSNFDQAVRQCLQSRRISPVAFFFDVDLESSQYLDYFSACCKLAKATKVVTVCIRSSELGTPFNEEVERLRKMVDIGLSEGIVVGVITERYRMTEDPDTVGVLCKSVEGLGVAIDPSHFVYQRPEPRDYDALLPRVCHVRLRDSTRDNLQVQIGQGIVEYGRLVIQLGKSGYKRALCIDILPRDSIDQNAELRKMRLLLESLLI